MFKELKINGMYLPRPDENLQFTSEKIKKEYETEAGTTAVAVVRQSKLTIKGTWTLTGKWMTLFRKFADSDTVTVECYFPSNDEMSSHECQFLIEGESHIKKSKEQLSVQGLYTVSVVMVEL